MVVPVRKPSDGLLFPLEFEKNFSDGNPKFFSAAERVIIMVTCILVSIASVVLVVGIIDLYMFIGDLREAVNSWATRLDGM